MILRMSAASLRPGGSGHITVLPGIDEDALHSMYSFRYAQAILSGYDTSDLVDCAFAVDGRQHLRHQHMV